MADGFRLARGVAEEPVKIIVSPDGAQVLFVTETTELLACLISGTCPAEVEAWIAVPQYFAVYELPMYQPVTVTVVCDRGERCGSRPTGVASRPAASSQAFGVPSQHNLG